MPLGQNLIELRARLGAVTGRFQLATYRDVIRLSIGGSPGTLSPRPKVVTVDPRKIGQWLEPGEVMIQAEDLMVTGVSRLYSRSQLESGEYLVNVEPIAGGIKGDRARLMKLYDAKATSWAMLLRPYQWGYTVLTEQPAYEPAYITATSEPTSLPPLWLT